MADSHISESRERDIEVSIIRAFATAIIEFEPVLYQKFLLQTRGIVTEELFKESLVRMEEKGYIAPLEFHGRQCWRRLANEDDVCAEFYTRDEVRGIIEEGQSLAIQRRRVPEEGTSMVTQTRRIAKEVLDLVKSQISKSKDLEDLEREKLRFHFESMRQKLADSEDEFLGYLQENLPSLHDPLRKVLNSVGVDILLPALRIIESDILEPNNENN